MVEEQAQDMVVEQVEEPVLALVLGMVLE